MTATPTILVATWSGGLFAVTSSERNHEIAGPAVRGLARDGHGAALAIVGGHALRRRAPGGAWTTLATSELELSCCVAVGDTIYVGTEDARMLRLDRTTDALEPIDSFDHTAGRDTWYAGSAIVNGQRMGPPLGIRSVAASADGSVLFANVHVGGIPRSLDGGRTWQPTIDIEVDVHEVCAHPTDPHVVAAASAKGLCLSRDAGATWTVDHDGLHAAYCSAVAFSGDDVLVSAAADHFANQGQIYRRPMRPDGQLVAVGPALDGIADTTCIATSGGTVAVVDRGGSLYLSTEHGRAWTRLGSGLYGPSSVLICP